MNDKCYHLKLMFTKNVLNNISTIIVISLIDFLLCINISP